MDNRREFIRKMMLLTGAAGVNGIPPSIAKALAIDPEVGSTFTDAEHIVILMQENRSFDHAFGTLQGVRGFNDPRAMKQPNDHYVWLQTNRNGETYAPFRFDIKDTKITWMGSLPHSRKSQVDARNNGRMDNWLEAKRSGEEEYKDMPLTMGYYTRDDIPFYYALADAFTICDQSFCSSLTPTDPNRLYFWSGTVREHKESKKAFIDNDEIEKGIQWSTFPELLEKNNISWKIYQNEVGIDGGFSGEEDSWLGNFGDNPLEYFKQYNIKLSKRYINYLPEKIAKLKEEIKKEEVKKTNLSKESREYKEAANHLKNLQAALKTSLEDQERCTARAFEDLPDHAKAIHKKAFVTNVQDPFRHQVTPLNYTDDHINREINIPKGDVLHQFRQDVEQGHLPTVSWLVAPENFSDHPSAPWFGSWYLSEAMDILTKDPEVWKKTIFILAYDENDGYFDHVPPFTAPTFNDPSTGQASTGIDLRHEHVVIAEDHPGPIGLGFRVPLIIASPWTRGGWVNSQVFDHTSTLQFLETFLSQKFGKEIRETNISQWRRTACGDLTSVFQTGTDKKLHELPFVKKLPFIESIHKAKFKNSPTNFKILTPAEISQVNHRAGSSSFMPVQENGIRPSCSIPYELYADGNQNKDGHFEIAMQASKNVFKERSAGACFIIYSRNFRSKDFAERHYTVTPGDTISDKWPLHDFTSGYWLELYGPNGFYRKFIGNKEDHWLRVIMQYETDNKNKLTGNVIIIMANKGNQDQSVIVKDNAYNNKSTNILVHASDSTHLKLDLQRSFHWYDFSIMIPGHVSFEKRYAGRVETMGSGMTDPFMGQVSIE